MCFNLIKIQFPGLIFQYTFGLEKLHIFISNYTFLDSEYTFPDLHVGRSVNINFNIEQTLIFAHFTGGTPRAQSQQWLVGRWASPSQRQQVLVRPPLRVNQRVAFPPVLGSR
jgi:hypothetical protein